MNFDAINSIQRLYPSFFDSTAGSFRLPEALESGNQNNFLRGLDQIEAMIGDDLKDRLTWARRGVR